MCTSQLDRDTLLAVDVVTQVERMIQERWGVEGNTLIDQIRALRTRKVDSGIIKMLHYLRRQRNQVVHHPRHALEDRAKFEDYAQALLPGLERSTSPDDFLQNGFQELLRKEFDSIKEELSLDQEIQDGFADLHKMMGRSG